MISDPKISYTIEFGVAMPGYGWVPAPRYLMRRNRILAHLPEAAGKCLLEIGCGVGALLYDFRRRGYYCEAVEISESALQLASRIHAEDPKSKLWTSIDELSDRLFDVLVACEVIEHIQEDEQALGRWSKLLKPGGTAIISAPGRPEKWNATDVWAGHFRRYTRESLSELCEQAGLTPVRIESYGYPLINVLEPIRAYLLSRRMRARKSKPNSSEAMFDATKQSGTNRNLEVNLYPFLTNRFGNALFAWFLHRQRFHVQSKKGNALICWAIKG